MISERQLIERMQRLKADVLHRWIEQGLIEPHRDAGGYQFDDIDEARIALVCDLHYGMGLEHESLPVVGVQFHPESVLTEHGHRLLGNWLASIASA